MLKPTAFMVMLLSIGLSCPSAQATDCATQIHSLEQASQQPDAVLPELQQQVAQVLNTNCSRSVALYILQANIHSRLAQWQSAINHYERALHHFLLTNPADIATEATRGKVTTEVELRLSILSSALRIPNRPLASDHLLKLRKLQQSPHLSTQLVALIQQYDLALSEDLSLRPLQTQEMIKAVTWCGRCDFGVDPVQLSYRIAFTPNTDQLDAHAKKVLAGMIEALRVPELKKIIIIDHTDQRGESNYNQRLSKQRAQAVVYFLVKEAPDLAAKLRAEGRGESSLLSTGHTETDHAQNRRVEFIFWH